MATLNALQSAYPELPGSFLGEVRRITARKRYSAWDLLALMDFETGSTFDPSVRNALGYVGLIQFGEAAASDLGVTQEMLASMTATEQLSFVEAYLDLREEQSGSALESLYDLYSAVLWPRGIGEPPGYVFFRAGDGRYGPNSGLDQSGDGTVTKREAAAAVAARLRGQESPSGTPSGTPSGIPSGTPFPRQVAQRASLGAGGPLLAGIIISAALGTFAYDYLSASS